ncbi:MAG: D-alanine--D-alanine ligase [Proteobacteria bacterium]|nr:D-alanine--D-alanine ligase [Pseudomonadota bacterium]
MPTKFSGIKTEIIAVLMGGRSSEREISLKSGKAVSQALSSKGWNVVELDLNENLPAELIKNQVSAAWIALHGQYGEDGAVQGLLEILNIPYTGSGVLACAVSMDKISTKRALKESDVRLAQDQILFRSSYETNPNLIEHFSLPIVVKDPIGGSSIGVWICHNTDDLHRSLKEAFASPTVNQVLLEELLEGKELTVAVLDGRPFPVVEIRPKTEFFDLEAKYTKGQTDYIVPAPISEEAAHDAQQQAKEAFNQLHMKGIARADFILTDRGPVFLEINSSPGMTATSLSPMAAGAADISFPELVEQVLLGASLKLG